MTIPTKPYDPTIEVNDILHESALRKVEFDKVCFGAKYQVFARNSPHEPWRHVAEATTEDEALAISKDDDRCFGGELLSEVDRRRASALRQLLDSELMACKPQVLKGTEAKVTIEGEMPKGKKAKA